MSIPSASLAPATDLRPSDAPDPELARQLTTRIWWEALAAGLVADGFSWTFGIGLNLTAYLAMVLFAAVSVLRLRFGFLPRHSARLLTVAALFALLTAVRESDELQVLNAMAFLALAILAVAAAAPVPLHRLVGVRLRQVIGTLVRSAAQATFGALLMLARLASASEGTRRSRVVNAVRVVALCIAVSVSFVALLAAGDPVFRNATSWLVHWSPTTLALHIGCTALFAWPILGVLWGNTDIVRGNKHLLHAPALPRLLRTVDVASALVSLNVVFAAFVAFQARAFFGGQSYVLATTGLSLAEYARGGFFTLIVTSGLVLSVLLACNALLPAAGLAQSKLLQRLSRLLLILDGVVLVSAAARMTIYMRAFGASLERVYAMAIIVWLGAVMCWFALTVLRNRPARFVWGGIGLAVVTLLSLNIASPDAIVARNHLQRAARGQLHDMTYLATQLSADAIPTLMAAMPASAMPVSGALMSATLQRDPTPIAKCRCGDLCAVLPLLQGRWQQGETASSLGAWSLGLWRAQRALRGMRTAPPQLELPSPITVTSSPSTSCM